MNRRDRWIAPAADGAILIDPPSQQAEELVAINRKRLNGIKIRMAGKSFQEVRETIQSTWLRSGPAVVTGHQPDFVHPGVWLKNFAAHGIARRLGLRALNVIIDTDSRKSTTIALPRFGSSPQEIGIDRADYDEWRGEELYHVAPIHNPNQFLNFAQTWKSVWQRWPFEPLLPQFWSRIRECWSESRERVGGHWLPPRFAECLLGPRVSFERAWGVENDELSMAKIHADEFYEHLLNDLPAFHTVYNWCVHDYRRRYRLRSRQHPVPDLARDSGFLEAPFWFIRQAKRYRGFVRMTDHSVQLRIAGQADDIECSRSAIMRTIGEIGYDVKPRALMTTLLLRLFLADLFLHGIGGAKYDEVTDDIIRRYFGIEPPEYVVVTGTLRLPFPRFPATKTTRDELWRRLRDLRWHPERFLEVSCALAEQKERWRERIPMTSHERRARYRELLNLTEALRPAIESELVSTQQRFQRCEEELTANEILTRRDYPFVLYPVELLRRFFAQVL